MTLDKVHIVGMSENGSTYLTVDEFEGKAVKPPIQVVLEGKDATSVAVTQDALAARYDDEELCQIGEGSWVLGLQRVIGEIATNGNLEYGATKPLHPNLIDAEVVAYAKLPASVCELTA
ncbi:hypothetical protein IPL85_00810 [Candidatus Saccharibacteria bacterium]|nr:MAG: hypothetical protein IPL85_00810 [Candidatus Saccharibacteria bacterium]